ncbi:family 20 glycosylhydrolase [Chryseolinea lacunae]|uniref:beta-N-acetylhexosaminidase n=1 Tax=Chryseolinea lacunae TaxID=2801331 RepID=A0ABS1KMG3_9BACT|nr:family 20 glycosylhydrolase [Chryseolinea lacunae]MBL0740432.1 family 20 glycosylhydrolase [Chryseolinea lacunae]
MTLQRFTILALLMLLANLHTVAQKPLATFPTRGFCIAAPKAANVDAFVKFINEELAPRQVNVLILRVDFNYQFEQHPELRDSAALSKADVKKLVKASKDHGIRLIPQINLLGHQSWAGTVYNLLRVYPQFDETPHVKMPAKYAWPNADGLYCKSYCPLHPDVHAVVFSMMDEICDAFESTAFHAGMDEVFYLGDDKCPRCGGRDKAELYAGEVRTLRDHLHEKNRELWIWGDRLLEGKITGLGMWEASHNNTHRAIDLIPKDVMICDWHYERPDKTAVIFANKGFKVATCPWRNTTVGAAQVADMAAFRRDATPEVKENYQGIIQTVWSDAESFLKGYYAKKDDAKANAENTPWNCFRTLFAK